MEEQKTQRVDNISDFRFLRPSTDLLSFLRVCAACIHAFSGKSMARSSRLKMLFWWRARFVK